MNTTIITASESANTYRPNRSARRRSAFAATAIAAALLGSSWTGASTASAATKKATAPVAAQSDALKVGIPATGKGSLKGMAQDPAATAASNNPQLTTLVAAQWPRPVHDLCPSQLGLRQASCRNR
jgi:hypothetical protein